jgi:RNA polymerase sigma factor (sigma-70 family)
MLFGEERLAARAGAGSERAFAALYERYHQRLYRYCRALLRNDADAQDALQATFASAYTALGRGSRNAPLRPWLYRIAHNESISILRRRREHAELSEAEAGVTPSAEETAAGRERLAVLVADLQQLPDRQRGALLMRELAGLSHEDIALALGTTAGAAKQTIFEARCSLQEFEEGRAMSCEEVCRRLSDCDRRALRGRRVRAHVRGCAACSAFAAAMPRRRTELNALAPPIAPAAAAGVLGAMLGHGGSGHGGAGTVAGAAGKTASLAVASKAAVGVALLAGATVGLTRALPRTHHHSPRPAATHSAPAPHTAGARVAGAAPASTRSHSHNASAASRGRHHGHGAGTAAPAAAATGAAGASRLAGGEAPAGTHGRGHEVSALHRNTTHHHSHPAHGRARGKEHAAPHASAPQHAHTQPTKPASKPAPAAQAPAPKQTSSPHATREPAPNAEETP